MLKRLEAISFWRSAVSYREMEALNNENCEGAHNPTNILRKGADECGAPAGARTAR